MILRGLCAATLLVGFALDAQLSNSAYRALGQPDLNRNATNMAQGAELNQPSYVAIDRSDGPVRIFVSDTRNHRILAWADAKTVPFGAAATLVLGQPTAYSTVPLGTGADGLALPLGLAVDPASGNLYVADFGNNRVLRFLKPFANTTRVEPDAVFGQPSFNIRNAGTDEHTLRAPRAVAFDSAGNLWVADSGNNRILRFPAAVLNDTNPAADLVIGQKDFVSGSAATSASGLNVPAGLTFDGQDNLYVSDTINSRVLKFTAPLATSQSAAIVYGQTNFTTRGVPLQASASTIASPQGLSVGADGTLYVSVPVDNRILIFAANAATGTAAKDVIGQSNFTVTAANSLAPPRASGASLAGVTDVKADTDGTLYVVDSLNNRALIFPSGSKSASQALGQPNLDSNGTNRIKPGSINGPYKMAIDYTRSPFPLYISDINNNRVLVWRDSARFLTGADADLAIGQPDLQTAIVNVDTRAQTPSLTSLSAPAGIAVAPGGTLYVADSGNHRVLRYPRPVDQTGRITPDAVIGQPDFTSSATVVVNASSLKSPTGLVFGPDGDLFVADSGNSRVLEFAARPGTGAAAIRVYGQPSFTSGSAPTSLSNQSLITPQGVAVDAAFNLFVCDTGTNRVLVFSGTSGAPATGAAATTVIGQDAFDTQTGGSAAARFKVPFDVAIDSQGDIFVSDNGNNRVLQFPSLLFLPNTGGAASAVFGQPNLGTATTNYDSSGGMATAKGLSLPTGLYFDRNDTLYVGDTGNNRVLHFLKPAVAVNGATFQGSSAIAPGSLVTVFGAGFSDSTQGISSLPLPNALAGREVVINDQVNASLLYLSPTQINLQIPAGTAQGSNRLLIRTSDTAEPIAGASLAVVRASPGFFTTTQDGKGQALATNQNGSTNSAANPANKGEVIILFGTGQGSTQPAVPDGQPAPSGPLAATVAQPTSDGATCLGAQPAVCVAIGSTLGDIQFSGLAPGFVGLWQLNVKIPAGALSGAAIPVRALFNGGATTNLVTIAIR